MTVTLTTITNGVVTLSDDANARITALTTQAKNNLAAAMWTVMTARSSGISDQISRLMTDIAKRNEDMKALNDEIARLTALKNGDTANDTIQDAAIAKCKSSLDSLNSTQQLDMVKMQDMMSKNGETTSLLSSVLKLIADQNQGVVQKM